MVWGSDYGFDNQNPPWDMRGQDAFESHAQRKASLMAIGALWGSSTPNFQPAAMSTIRSHGSIPFFTWGPMSGGGSDQPTYRLANIINGQFDPYITRFAQDAKAWGHPFFLRLAWEMNGTWYPWSEARNGNQPGEYVRMWRHVHDIFTAVGASNANWVWCPNTEYSGSITPLAGLYPGDAYVDWTCLDGYNWGTNPWKPNVWQSFDQVFRTSYQLVTGTIAPAKPLIIGETASSEYGGSKAAWITDMLTTQLPRNYPRVKAFLWFNHAEGADWPIETSATATTAFATGINTPTYATNTFATLTGPKIQPIAQ